METASFLFEKYSKKIHTNFGMDTIMIECSHMKNIHNAIRIITGLFFVAIFFSKFGFLPSAAHSPEMFSATGWVFISAINEIGYLFPVIGLISLASGVAFLANRYVALAALLMLPLTVNFALFHIFVGLPMETHFLRESAGFIPLALNVYMIYSQRKKYKELLKP